MTAHQAYQCSRCEDVHSDEYDAEECCKPEVWSVFVCDSCDEVHEIQADALACCHDDQNAPGPYYVDPVELERQGQLRLPLVREP